MDGESAESFDVLSSAVRRWAGLPSDEGEAVDRETVGEILGDAYANKHWPRQIGPTTLAGMNDKGFTFEDLANVIERVL